MKSKKTFKNIDQKKIWDPENIFYLKTDITRISKLIYQYEIYKKILDLPGDIIECGVFKGVSLVRLLTFRENLENCFSRKILGFDAFGLFPRAKNDKKTKKLISPFRKGISKDELSYLLKKKQFKNFELIKGDVRKTLPIFLKKKTELKISLLHLDMDIYEPTKFVLKKLYDKIVRGGIILIDDYNVVPGATKATDEFLKKNKSLKIQKLGFYKLPAFIKKI